VRRLLHWAIVAGWVVLCAISLYAAITAGSEGVGITNTTTASVTIDTDTSPATTLIVACVASNEGVAAPTISSSPSLTWNARTAYVRGGTTTRTQLHWALATSVSDTHSITSSVVVASFPVVGAIGLAGTETSTPYDTENGANSGGTSVTVPSITPSANGAVLVSCATGSDNDGTDSMDAEAGFTEGTESHYSAGAHWGLRMAYKIQTTATAEDTVWDMTAGSNEWVATTAAFKAPSAGGGALPCVGAFGLLGVGCNP
jgi:hypothetical protein